MTAAQKIRNQLRRTPNASTEALVNRLNVSKQQVYQARHDLKKQANSVEQKAQDILKRAMKTRLMNKKPLGEYILQVLENSNVGLQAEAIAFATQKAGYVSNSTMFVMVVRQKLYDLARKGLVVKIDNLYRQSGWRTAPEVVAENQVLGDLAKVSQLSKELGGIDKVQEYLSVLRQLQ